MDFRDELYFLALTVVQESWGEPWNGQLAVAYVPINRGGSIIDNVLRDRQFSSWNSDSGTRLMIDSYPTSAFAEAYKAAAAAYWRLVPDPGKGATHYLNENLTRVLRGGKRQPDGTVVGGSLPSWFNEKYITVRIGNHTFLKLG